MKKNNINETINEAADETKVFEHRYQVTIKALSEDAIKRNGQMLEDRETNGLLIIANVGENETLTGMIGVIDAYYYGKHLAKLLKQKKMLDRFIEGMKSTVLYEGLEDLLSALKEIFQEEQDSDE